MNSNSINQINWTFTFILVSSYIFISIFILKLFVNNYQPRDNSTVEETTHLLTTDSHSDDEEVVDENNTNILISLENDYINDINTLYNIEANNHISK